MMHLRRISRHLLVIATLAFVLAGVTPAQQSVSLAGDDAAKAPADLEVIRRYTKDTSSGDVGFSADGSRVLACGLVEQAITIWDFETAEELRRIEHPDGMLYYALSPDEQWVASTNLSGKVLLIEAETGDVIDEFSNPPFVAKLTFSPNGKLLASAGYAGVIRIWNIETGDEVATLRGHRGAVSGVRFFSDSNRLASSAADQTAKIWDLSSGQVVLDLKHPDTVWCMQLSPDDRLLATGTGGEVINLVERDFTRIEDNLVRIWDTQSGELIASLSGHTDTIRDLDFTPDSRRIVSSSNDTTIRVWDVESQTEVARGGEEGWIDCLAVSPDGAYVVCGGGYIKGGGSARNLPDEYVRLFRLPSRDNE